MSSMQQWVIKTGTTKWNMTESRRPKEPRRIGVKYCRHYA